MQRNLHRLIPVAMTGSLAAALLTVASAGAQAKPAQPAKAAQPAKPAQPAAPAMKVKEDKPGLLAKAKVSPDSAMTIARNAVPGGTITSAEIEMEKGVLIYSFDLSVAGKKGTEEVHVNALTGKLLSKEHESAADEKKEKAKDAMPKAKPAKPPVDR
ncbi:MAG: PepSY domain-containing protein [Gemmatimonadaceae bacterium]